MRFGAVLVGLSLFAVAIGATPQQGERTIYVSAVGANGMPVVDPPLTAAELTVAEDGAAREITSITKATEPVYFALLYETSTCEQENERNRKCDSNDNESNATNYLQTLREALAGFINVVLTAAPTSKILLMDFGGAAVMKHDFTSNPGELEPLVRKLVTTKTEPVLHEALIDAAGRLAKAPTRRRVIVTVNREPTTEGSRIDGKRVADEVRKSAASVWGLSVRYGSRHDGSRDVLLKGMAGNSGGLRLTLGSAPQLGDYLRSVAANTIVQYAVTFKRPADAPPVKLTTVKTTRAGVQPLTLQWSDK